eukprot:CAMPEP_0198731752 /NCGR_PEP_ID=MMETSP1475-20131203/31913_1 /TAXON_ID= ORGANISM="Unidentified sp., Strain CCMP1999" /NCGR_SAMPLE_ID=MMETSP1475 /ASSEMBLY_ACC=CAM_ASM_001111 /LENGTH=739 /DNA_ID=CAMNT_0044494757 /DNA_START=90 /DNA_END=2309 /DNA_ORIENTATION=-
MTERKYELAQVVEVHSMRHLLQQVAVEIYFRDKDPAFFAMETEASREAFLKALESQLKRAGKHYKIYKTVRSRQLAIREATHRWKRRLMSNFHYLMTLNRLSGRSYNDAAQYPVFPWVLKDYSSETLDLKNPNSFRNFSKPMGCQPSDDDVGTIGMSKRETMFRQRYSSWADPRGIPPFHYGSHYSSTGIVVHFLVRMEPFASLFLDLQGGHFDYPDRMFRSVEGAWRSASTSTQNVMELVPELFYNPEFARNRNSLPLGTTQDGYVIGDVVLPPWADGSPETFIRLHREALESPYVSEHLGSWIDLIFGCKQRGKAAVDACNVFYYLTYEGSVDLGALDLEYRSGLLEQIRHYGQTPLQLFKKPHVSRDPPTEPRPRVERSVTMCFDTDMADSVVWIMPVHDLIFTVGRSRSLGVHRLVHHPEQKSDSPFTLELDVRFSPDTATSAQKRGRGRRVGGAHIAPFTPESSLFGAFVLTTDAKTIISVGHWDGSIRCQSVIDPGRPKQIVRRHRRVVSCVAMSANGEMLVTGSRDSSIFLWDLLHGSESEKIIDDEPRYALRGHMSSVTCVAISSEVGVVVSANEKGICMMHSIRDGRVMRVLERRIQCSRALLTPWAELILMSASERTIRTVTINDEEIARATLPFKPTAICTTADGRFIVDSNEHGDVCVRSSWNLEVLLKYDRAHAGVSALTMNTDETAILAGLADGKLVVHVFDRDYLLSRTSLVGMEGPLTTLYPV